MAVRIEDDCVECPDDRGCLGSACPYKTVKIYTCDVCGEEHDADEMHEVDGVMVCDDCLVEYLEDHGIIGGITDD